VIQELTMLPGVLEAGPEGRFHLHQTPEPCFLAVGDLVRVPYGAAAHIA